MATAAPAVGQEHALRALAADMRRATLVVGAAVGPVAVVVCGFVAGLGGVLGAVLATAIGIGSALFTLWLMRRTAGREPRAVMLASFGGYIQKAIILLVALMVADSIPVVHRMSLAVTLLVVLITVTTAEGWAAYRSRPPVLDVGITAD